MAAATPHPHASEPTRLWVERGPKTATIVVLTQDTFLGLDVPLADVEGLEAGIAQGRPLPELFGKQGEGIPLERMHVVKANEKDAGLKITWVRWGGSEFFELGLADKAVRDEIYEALREALGPDAREKRVQHSTLRAALVPGFWALVALAGTIAFAAIAAGSIEGPISGRRRAMKQAMVWLAEALGPVGVSIVGGVIVLVIVWWMVKRMKDPPVMRILKPAK